jgi:hypothetical protein
MIRGAADRLWLMKIWCVQWKRKLIANKEKIQTDHFNSQGHVYSVFGQKKRSACEFLASRLNNQRKCLLRRT